MRSRIPTRSEVAQMTQRSKSRILKVAQGAREIEPAVDPVARTDLYLEAPPFLLLNMHFHVNNRSIHSSY